MPYVGISLQSPFFCYLCTKERQAHTFGRHSGDVVLEQDGDAMQ